MASEARLDEPEPISPELVLVAPSELARLARDELPEPPVLPSVVPASDETQQEPSVGEGAREAVTAHDGLPEPPPYLWVAAEEPLPESRERQWRRFVLVCAVAGGIFAGVAYLAVMPRHGRHAADVAVTTSRTAPTPASAQETTPISKRPTANRDQTTKPQPTAKPQQTAKPKQTGKSKQTEKSKQTKSRAELAQSAPFVPARTWTWAASKGARGYEMRFVLNGRVVLRMRTTQPRIHLPRSFRFHAGTYRWLVQSIPAQANARPIVDSTFVLTAATAARGNG